MWWSLLLTVCATVLIFLRYYKNGTKTDKLYITFDGYVGLFKSVITANSFHEIFIGLYKKFGRQYRLNFFGLQIYVLGDPLLIRQVLVKDFHIFPDRLHVDITGDPIIDDLIIFMKHQKWRTSRKAVGPVFTRSKMKTLAPHIRRCIDELIKDLNTQVLRNAEINIKELFDAFTIDIIAIVVFGLKVNAYRNPSHPLATSVKDFVEKFTLRRLLPAMILPSIHRVLNIKLFPQNIADFLVNVIEKRRNSKSPTHIVDLLTLLMKVKQEDDINENEIGEGLTNGEILSHSFSFLVAGFHTTAITLSCAALALALNPECQETLIREIDDAQMEQGELTLEVIEELPYLSATISEVLRLYTAVPLVARVAVQDCILNGEPISAGTSILIPTLAIHRDSEFFPDPDKFDPERFLPENKSALNDNAYLPFGMGPRNCNGAQFSLFEIKMTLAHVLSKFRFQATSRSYKPLKLLSSSPFFSPKEVVLKVVSR